MDNKLPEVAFDMSDLDFIVLPGGGDEPVLHVPLVIAVVYAVWGDPAG